MSLRWGLDIEGSTLMRQQWAPMTYDQALKESDKRELIDQHGNKALFLKTTDVNGRKLTAVAYRNGNGTVTLGLSTVNGNNHFDCVLKLQRAKDYAKHEEL